ncbi:12777_t:CDS:2, partial [Entrophospora sp. SA101]
MSSVVIMEVWLPVEDLLVSNIGRIKNKKGIILRPGVCKRSGYVPTVFRINENKPYVNHINGIKHDNQAVNLEWVTPKENAECKVFPNHGRGNSRWTIQKALDEEVIQIWNSICLTGNTLKIAENSISECCSGKRNTASGWCWIYYENYIPQDPNNINYKTLAFCSKEEGKDCVNHIDGNRTNNKASNLEWCTQKENTQHAV